MISQNGAHEGDERPSRRGGPAALSGFLYQIVATLGQASTYHIDGASTGKNLTHARLVVEPSTGGDSDFDGVVIQYKSKRTGNWTPSEIVKRVLPDLLRSFETRDRKPSKLIFSTDAPPGNVNQFLGFVERIGNADTIADVNREQLHAGVLRKKAITDFCVLNEIARLMNKNTESETPIHILFSVLKIFEIQFSATLQDAHDAIQRVLLEFVGERGRVEDKKRALLLTLFEWSAEGNRIFTTAELFERVGIRSIPLSQVGQVCGNLSERLRTLLPSIRYSVEQDVRPPLAADPTATIVVITGDSGLGKTWSLCRSAVEFSNSEWCVFVQVDSNQTFSNLTEIVAREFCLYGWKQDEVCDFEVVNRRINYIYGDRRPKFVLFVTGNYSYELFKRVINYPWEHWGIRIFIECPLDLAENLRPIPKNVVRIDTRRFLNRERDEYLRRNGISWSQIPLDVNELLLTPIFCRIYIELSNGLSWFPDNEYELINNYWNSKFSDVFINRPKAKTAFLSLVHATVNENVQYPWPARTVAEIGLPDDIYQTFVRIGALNPLLNGHTKVWHDRILNWSVAQALVERLGSEATTSEEISRLLATLSQNDPVSGVRYGYVLLDFFWIHQKYFPHDSNKLLSITKNLEADRDDFYKWFYENGLPTLGEIGVRLMMDRLLQVNELGDESAHFLNTLRRGLLNAAKFIKPDQIAQSVLTILQSPNRNLHLTAFQIAERVPHRAVLPVIWQLFLERDELRGADADAEKAYYRMAVRKALYACLRSDGAEWLDEQLGSAQHHDVGLRTLVDLVSQLPVGSAQAIWERHREKLLQHQDAIRQPLAKLIAFVGNDEEIDAVENWLAKTNDRGEQAEILATVIFRRPELIKANLDRLTDKGVLRYGILPTLGVRLAASPDSLSIDDLVSLFLGDRETWWAIPGLLIRCSATIEQRTYDDIQKTLIRMLTECLENGHVQLGYARSLAEAISTTLDASPRYFQSSSKSEKLEHLLGKFAKRSALSRGGLDVPLDWDLMRRLLIQLGGSGLESSINNVLTRDNPWAHRLVIGDAGRYGTEKTSRRLRKIVRSQDVTQKQEHAKERLYLGQIALAQLGDWDEVVRAALRTGYLPTTILEFEREPFESASIDAALEGYAVGVDIPTENILAAILLSGHTKYLDSVREIFETLDVDDPRLPTAVQCLNAYRVEDNQFVDRVGTALTRQKKNQLPLVNALLRVNTEIARRILFDYTVTVFDSGSYNILYIGVIIRLSDGDDDIARLAKEFIGSRERRQRFSRTHSEILVRLPDIQGESSYDLLQRTALADTNMVIYGEKSSAIIGLSKIDLVAACEAIEALFEMRDVVREQLPLPYVKIDHDKAIPFLTRRLTLERSAGTRTEICRSLRLCGGEAALAGIVRAYLDAASLEEIQSGIEIAGWWPSRFFGQQLNSLARNHPVEDIRIAAAGALVRLKHQEWTLGYFEEFRNSNRFDKWRCLEAICRLTDPFLLARHRDPLWIGHALKDEDPMYWEWAEEEIRRRQDKWRSDNRRWDD